MTMFACQLERELRAKDEEIARLERLVYVPGVTKCAKCSCSLISSTLNAATGQNKANTEPQQCPNGCGPMWRVTERDAGNELVDRLDAMFARAEAAETRVRELEDELHSLTGGAFSEWETRTKVAEARVRELEEDAANFAWLAGRLQDVQIDNADPCEHLNEAECDADADAAWVSAWRRAINAARGERNE